MNHYEEEYEEYRKKPKKEVELYVLTPNMDFLNQTQTHVAYVPPTPEERALEMARLRLKSGDNDNSLKFFEI